MAARRCRIKAVANLPIRRDRGGGIDEHSLQKEIKEKSSEQNNKIVEENPTTSKDETLKENNSNIVSLKVNSPKNVIFNHPSNEPTINDNNALIRPSEEISQSNISVVISPQTNGNDHEKQQDSETSTLKVKAIVSESKSTEQDSVLSKLPNKFVGRKRVKPAVSISNISRKAKEIILVTDEVLPEPNAFRSNHETSSTSSNCHFTTVEESPITDKSKYISLSQVDVTLPSDKDIGVGMPTIIQTIPTGAAIRPNESNCPSNELSAPGLLQTNGEAPQTLPEADLPSEGAGGSTGGLAMDPPCLPNIVPCPSNTPHRSKFARPTPRIPDKTSRRRGHSSASESDDDSKRPFINSGTSTIRSKFARPSPKVGDATSRRTGNQGSASESDDESRRPSLSKSPALTSVLPMSSRITTKTINGTENQGSASESEDDVIIVEPDPVKEPSCMEKQQDKNSGIGSKELVGESEKRDENIKSVWSKRTINHIRRKRHNAINSRIAQGKKELDTKLKGSKPARSSLTMFDLIYYNPSTNPMKKVVPSESVDHNKSIIEGENRLVEERLTEEAVDDVTNSTSNVEEETALPVPQVKVGPDGQLILDEMSLVIETTGAKKSREELENSSIVVDLGIGSTSYSAYSKKTYKKGKEWSAHDTLKFYRALNTLGTDFLLMQSIFPKMTRRDLKMKFKREERVNAALIDKALRYPLNFDMSELQKEAQREAVFAIKMAARRCRIKAVANLPIRRDRGGGIDEHSLQKEIKEKSSEQNNKIVEENPTTSKDETLKENNSNIVSLKVNSPKNVIFNHPSNEPTINDNNALIRPSEELSQSNISVVISPQTNGNDHEKQQDSETSNLKVKAIVSESKSTKQDSVLRKLPNKFVGRKRIKPAVSISKISRKAKEIILVTDEVLPEPNAFRSNHETSSTSSNCHLTTVEESPITDKSKYIILSQVDVTLPSDKDIGVGMPTIIQTILTGAAIRPNESNCPSNELSAPGLLQTNGEAPQTLPEADLPSEGAGGSSGGLAMDPPCLPNIVPCPSNTPHRSKFARPTPRIPDKTSRRRGHSSTSESDDDSKRPFINSGTSTIRSKFARPSPKVGDATSRRTGNQGSASESDDESRRPSLSKSPALTSVLPMSSRITTKTINGTENQGSASESENDVIIVEPDPVKEPSCMEKQQDKNSGIGSNELVGESEERDENNKSVWSKRTINHIRRKCYNAINSRIAQGKKELDTKLKGSKPARRSLTMFDLIYYNPSTNPMKKVVPSESVDHTKCIIEGENRLVEERLTEEAVDDVTNSTSNVEEETALPVPQVKVGPDGQLILDEMSLVIETTGATKSREELENSSIVVDLGIGSKSYSAYSKKTHKKGKEWSAHDTLKFYRALNTLGTDFLLMQSIFPKMTRRDLKMKFKREERVNAALIDKVLCYPLNFDMSELRKEAQREAEMEIEQEERRK